MFAPSTTLPGVRFHTVTSCPALATFVAMECPMIPNPKIATRILNLFPFYYRTSRRIRDYFILTPQFSSLISQREKSLTSAARPRNVAFAPAAAGTPSSDGNPCGLDHRHQKCPV